MVCLASTSMRKTEGMEAMNRSMKTKSKKADNDKINTSKLYNAKVSQIFSLKI